MDNMGKRIKKNSPFNYAGDKSTYTELFDVTDPVADLFGGGGGYWSNVKSERILVNDVCEPLVKFQERVYKDDDAEFERMVSKLKDITNRIDSREMYEDLRRRFNESGNEMLFMCLLSTCTNNLVRFNKSGGFNQTWGKRRFNENMESKLRDFRSRIRNKDIEFYHGDFSKLDVTGYTLFVDPPYLISSAGYNTTWKVDDELRLYEFLKGRDFILTNYLTKGDMENEYLRDFIESNGYDWFVIREGKMQAQKKSDIFKEIVVHTVPIRMPKIHALI